jgi:DmsE family decaheme c-type cytochrome
METAVLKSNSRVVLRRNHSIRRQLGAVLAVGMLALGVFTPAWVEAQTSRNVAGPDAQFTPEGTDRCLFCHGGESMTLMAETAHGNPANPDAPYAQKGCESCHGPGSLHVSRARGGRGFPALIRFGSDRQVTEQTEACIDCHAKDMGELEGMEWAGSAHDVDKMTCVSCHQMHIVGSPLEDQTRQRESCAHCHEKQIANHRRFESAGIVFDKLSCYDCHDVHQLIREP